MASRSRRAAVLGRPVARSLSPALHRAAYAALGLDWSYDAIDCGIDELPAVLRERMDWAGFSCTMPLKHAVMSVAGQVSSTASTVGAANTLLPAPEGGWLAENTDVAGIVAALAEKSLRPARVTVLGAGGTAQAAVVALAQSGLGLPGSGVARCSVLVRDPARAGRLVEIAARAGIVAEVATLSPDAAQLDAELIISTLPPGAADPVAARSWSARQAVLDVVYAPWPTPLTQAVRSAGGVVVSGALMLLHQAAAQVELMTGFDAPVEAMREALRAADPGCGV